MGEIKAIETVYNGYRFRSRLEARWAVFFDALGIEYEYEPEGFALQNGSCYLPDFFLPEIGIYVEIKPNSLDSESSKKAHGKMAELCNGTGACGIFCCGDPFQNNIVIYAWIHGGWCEQFGLSPGEWAKAEFVIDPELIIDSDFLTITTRKISGAVIAVGDRYSKINFSVSALNNDYLCRVVPFNKIYSFSRMPRDEQIKARQARFEHGECG